MANPAAGVQQYWADQLDLLRLLPTAVGERQPESIHDLRAAGRRIKATVRVHRPLIRRSLASTAILSLDAYNAVLGQARDAEVIADLVAELLGPRPDAQAVIAALEAERMRTAALADVLLSGEQAAQVLDTVAELVADPWSARPDKPSRGPGRNAVLRRVRWAERRVADEWRQGPDREEDEHVWMHRLRRRAKAARYAHESITAAVPESQDAAAAYAKVATLLGVVQDSVVVTQRLSAWSHAAVTEALAAQEQRADKARREAPEAIRTALFSGLLGDWSG